MTTEHSAEPGGTVGADGSRPVDPGEWSRFFDVISRDFADSTVSVEIRTPGFGPYELARDVGLLGLVLNDADQGEASVEIVLDGSPETHLSHTVDRPSMVLEGPEDEEPRWLEIRSHAGEVVRLRWRDHLAGPS